MTRVLGTFLGIEGQAFHEADRCTKTFIRVGCGTKCLALHDVPGKNELTVMRDDEGVTNNDEHCNDQ